MRNGVKQPHRRHDRLGQRQHDARYDPQLPAPVDPGRINNFVRQIHEERAHDEQVVGADRARNDQGPYRIQHVQRFNEQIIRDQGSAEDKSNQHEHENGFSSPIFIARQRIGQRGRCNQVDPGPHDSHQYTDQKGTPYGSIVQDDCIVGERKLNRPQANVSPRNGHIAAERLRRYVQDRKDHGRRHDGQEDIVENFKYEFAC